MRISAIPLDVQEKKNTAIQRHGSFISKSQGGGENVEVLKVLDEIEEQLENSTRIPMTGKAIIGTEMFLDYIDKIRSYGIKVSDDGVQAAESDFPTAVKTRKACPEMANTVIWQYKALTERDLLDIEKGSIVNVGRKCIVTSLAVDAARRKSIQICREGEGK
jgi:hypothetical protein